MLTIYESVSIPKLTLLFFMLPQIEKAIQIFLKLWI